MVHVEDDAAPPTRPSRGAWLVTWLAFVAGIAASVAANVAHAAGSVGARAVAGWAPLALLLTIEVMMRVPAPRHRALAALRYLGTVVVAGVAAVASYRHMRGLALAYGEDELTAATLPLSVDGLVVVASIALLVLADQRRAAIAAAAAPASTAVEPLPAPDPVPEPDSVPPAAAEPLPHLEPAVPPVPWPAQQQALPLPPPDPVMVPADAATEALWAAARQAWRDSLAAGQPLTGKALAERFGRKERWGRDRIAEAKAELAAEAAGDVAGETDQRKDLVPAGAGAE